MSTAVRPTNEEINEKTKVWKMIKERCAWVNDDPIYIHYHDHEWGVPIYDDRLLFEFLILEGMQAGLNWLTILKKREHYQTCFDHFNPEIISNYDQNKFSDLMANPGIIRNKLKIQSVIVNSNAYLKIKEEYASFSSYIWNFVNGHPIQNHWTDIHQVPTKTLISDAMAHDLKKRGFKFIGSTICYAFMQATGMANDHTTNCFCYENKK